MLGQGIPQFEPLLNQKGRILQEEIGRVVTENQGQRYRLDQNIEILKFDSQRLLRDSIIRENE
jgi:hypothetical protein